ncbi:NADH-ubiquinone oxidoreductase-F iron-sulfur binding region domain-containing protein [Leifsonia sp. 2MCAF36]|uniref:NADH-ubiquinone oxidoreductase-F iron-sulfur binding region domain-containing protein n=1 Tax=Leifsonia sp. 2MCAF36 TaxID=3232988 RepID=UPI003F98162F
MTADPGFPAAAERPAGANRLLSAGTEATLEAHLRAFGPLPACEPHASLAQLEASGLTGRGGAGFPAWRKLAAVGVGARRSRGRAPILIANGSEGEPLSWKDAVLLQNAPHLVIDGMLAAGRMVGARNVLLYVGSASLPSVERAIAERPDARGIEVVEAADSFIAGEASAVVNAIGNDDPRPTDRIVRLTESGLRGRPTLVQNVETLAHLALIARFGGAWFRSIGTPEQPGTRLVTVTGDVPRTGVFEVPTDATLSDVLGSVRLDADTASAVLVGGYHGAWVPAAAFDTPLTPAGLAPFGAQPGAGIVHVLGDQRCGLQATAEIVGYLAGQTAGQCGPCMFGLPTMAARFAALAAGSDAKANAADLVRVSNLVVGRGACHHPDGTVRLIRSALHVFARDVRAHADGRCTRRPR